MIVTIVVVFCHLLGRCGRDAVGGPGLYPVMDRFFGWKLKAHQFLRKKKIVRTGQGRGRPTVLKNIFALSLRSEIKIDDINFLLN
jgi:hypothetical protein